MYTTTFHTAETARRGDTSNLGVVDCGNAVAAPQTTNKASVRYHKPHSTKSPNSRLRKPNLSVVTAVKKVTQLHTAVTPINGQQLS